MKEFFLVNNDIENMRKDGKWVDVSLDAIKNSAKINVPNVKVFTSRKDAERAALDGADLAKDTDFFPVIRVEVPDNLKGRNSFYHLEDGSKIASLSFSAAKVNVTDVYLSHIDKSYADTSLRVANKKTNKEDKTTKSTTADRFARVRAIGAYLPSVKNTLKNGIPLAAGVAAWYFGNAEVASLVAKTTYALPEAIATHAWLPAMAGTTLRVAAEVPELAVKAPALMVKAGKGIASLCGAGMARLRGKKAVEAKSTVSGDLTAALATHMATGADKPKEDIVEDKAVTPAKKQQTSAGSPLRELIPQKAPAPAAEKPTLH
ncbi:MAG: hypothetical protein AB7I18_08800 [Candidatus Berkiella sp.]